MEKIRIVHTNDLHSHFESFPKVGRYLAQAQKDEHFDQTLTFDAGDFMDRSHPLTEATNGQINIEFMNSFHYDAVTIGNNEGVCNPHEVLAHLFDEANFDVVLADVFNKDGSQVDWAQPYKIIKTKKGTRIAVIGFTAAYPMTYKPNVWEVKQPVELLGGLLEKLAGRYDLLFLLTHVGIGQDRLLAKKFPQIDLIIGGHSHTLLPGGEKYGHTWIVQTGKWGRYIGDVTVKIDDAHNLLSIAPKTVKTEDLPEMPGDEELIRDWWNHGYQLLARHKVAFLPEKFEDDTIAAVQVSLDAMASFAKTDLALLNSGLFLAPFKEGLITRADLHKSLPHPMHVARAKLKGRDLWRLVMEVEKNRHFLHKFPLRGMSFRGKIFGDIYYKGLKLNHHDRQVYVQGHKIDKDKDYTIAVLDHHILVPFFPTLAIVGHNTILAPQFLREVVADYLAKKYPLPGKEVDARG